MNPEPPIFSLLLVDDEPSVLSLLQKTFARQNYDLHMALDGEEALAGLGLPLARKLVEMHGGRIDVQSAGEGKGSTFTFSIPTNITSIVDKRPSGLDPAAIA